MPRVASKNLIFVVEAKKIKGIIFDLDGVLIDSEKYQTKAWLLILKKYGISLKEKDLFEIKGKSADIIEKELKRKYNLKIRKGELKKKRDEIILKIYQKMKRINLMPYAKMALIFFKKKFKKIGLASNGNKKEVFLKIKKAKIFSYFSVILTRDDVKKGKPYPEIYLKAAKKLGFLPSQCLAIEDTQPGLKSAKLAGLFCFVVPNRFSKSHNFLIADKVFKSLKDIVNYFKENEKK